MRKVSIRRVSIVVDMPMDMPMDMGMDIPMDIAWTFDGRKTGQTSRIHPSASRGRPRLVGHCLDIRWTLLGQRSDIHREAPANLCSIARCMARVISLWPLRDSAC